MLDRIHHHFTHDQPDDLRLLRRHETVRLKLLNESHALLHGKRQNKDGAAFDEIPAQFDLIGLFLFRQLAVKMRDTADLAGRFRNRLRTSTRDSIAGPRATDEACT